MSQSSSRDPSVVSPVSRVRNERIAVGEVARFGSRHRSPASSRLPVLRATRYVTARRFFRCTGRTLSLRERQRPDEQAAMEATNISGHMFSRRGEEVEIASGVAREWMRSKYARMGPALITRAAHPLVHEGVRTRPSQSRRAMTRRGGRRPSS